MLFRIWLMLNLVTAIAGAGFLNERESSTDLWVVFTTTVLSTILEVR